MVDADGLSWLEANEHLSRFVRGAMPADRKMHVIEAGCGQKWGLAVDSTKLHITGIDLDKAAIDKRVTERGDLDVAIHGDATDPVHAPEGSIDVVYAAYVIEHLPQAEDGAGTWARWLRPGGMIVAKVPDARSVHGFMSSATPHWFHEWVFKYVFGRDHVGEPGYPPYRVHYSRLTTAAGIRSFAAEHQLEVLGLYGMRDLTHVEGSGLKFRLLTAGKALLARLSLGRLTNQHDNLWFVLQRPATA